MPEFDTYDAFDDRETLSEADALALQKQGVLAVDPERALPLWFDGRYLAARDLNREQNYFLSRQSAIGKAIGRGVIEGLVVRTDSAAGLEGSQLEITAGQGIAFDGAHILLPRNLKVNLSDLSVQDALNAKLGLSVHPSASIRGRTGLFVLSLRAVEYTANQTAAFPTHVTGERSATMGDRIEAVAVTVTPFAPIDAPLDADDARSMAAQRLFHGMSEIGTPGNALPLAMMALRNGSVEWLDIHMVRRDLVASRRDFLGLGLSRDQLRLAHFNQYRAQMTDLVTAYADRGQPARFNAEQHFRVLPAAGPVPAAAIDPAAQTQLFFPGEVEVELSIIPDDELPALIDDSFELPPIDLTRRPEERDSISVMVLAPLPRHVLRSQISALGQLQRPLRPISLLGQGPQKPIDKLGTMRIALADVGAALEAEATPATEAWADVIRALVSFGTAGDPAAPMLWYIRRRTLRENADLEAALASVEHLDTVDDGEVVDPDQPVEEPEQPDPDQPEPEPEPQPEEELSEIERRVLLRLSGFGDLAAIVRNQMVRLNDRPRAMFGEALSSRQFAQPLAVVALTARVADLRANEVQRLQDAVEKLGEADPAGLNRLNAALMAGSRAKITEVRFKQLSALVVPEGMLEAAAKAAGILTGDLLQRSVRKLEMAIREANPDFVKEVVEEMMRTAEEAGRRPEPREDDDAAARAAEEARRRAEIEAARRRAEQQAAARARALVGSVEDKTQARTLERALGKADTGTRDRLVSMLTAARIGQSRIATEAVLKELGTGGAIRSDKIAKIRPIDANFVSGLSAIEPHLLEPPKARERAQPSRGAAARARPAARATVQPSVATRARSLSINRPAAMQPAIAATLARQPSLAVALRTSPEVVVTRRVQLLAANPGLRLLANFGGQNRGKTAVLKKAAQRIVPTLDAKTPNQTAIRTAIVRAIREAR